MAIEALEGVTDEQLFNEANADEAPAETVVAEPAEVTEEQPGQARDEAGRFAGKPEDKPEAALTDEKPPIPPKPEWRKAEDAERARAAESELAILRQRLEALERPQPRSEPAAKVEIPDPLLQPKEYQEFIEARIEARILNDRREESLQRAAESNPDEFKEAYAAAQQAVDPALKARMQNSRDPGKTLLEWHRENKTRAEVGTDPNAYFDKRLEAFLSDPANQAKVLERIRGGVQPANTGKPAPVSLPPSLTRATAAAANEADDSDISNDGLWRHANA